MVASVRCLQELNHSDKKIQLSLGIQLYPPKTTQNEPWNSTLSTQNFSDAIIISVCCKYMAKQLLQKNSFWRWKFKLCNINLNMVIFLIEFPLSWMVTDIYVYDQSVIVFGRLECHNEFIATFVYSLFLRCVYSGGVEVWRLLVYLNKEAVTFFSHALLESDIAVWSMTQTLIAYCLINFVFLGTEGKVDENWKWCRVKHWSGSRGNGGSRGNAGSRGNGRSRGNAGSRGNGGPPLLDFNCFGRPMFHFETAKMLVVIFK